jgi:hypothetical protein
MAGFFTFMEIITRSGVSHQPPADVPQPATLKHPFPGAVTAPLRTMRRLAGRWTGPAEFGYARNRNNHQRDLARCDPRQPSAGMGMSELE